MGSSFPQNVGDYALVGDSRTAALIDPWGSVDWMCLPAFDGEPVFARLLAGEGGGSFSIVPAGAWNLVDRRYRPHTAVVESEYRNGDATLRMTDGMVAEVAGTPQLGGGEKE